MINYKEDTRISERVLYDLLDNADKEQLVNMIIYCCPKAPEFVRRFFRDFGELTKENCLSVAKAIENQRKAVSTIYGKAKEMPEKEQIYIYLVLLFSNCLDEAEGTHHSNPAVMINKKLHNWIKDYDTRKYIISIMSEIMIEPTMCIYRNRTYNRGERHFGFLKALYSYEDTKQQTEEILKDFSYYNILEGK